jgi:predicted porin
MKKSLIALAVFGVVSGLASAQSNIAIYGVVDVGVSHDSNAVGSTTAVNSGILNGSRLGFKGAWAATGRGRLTRSWHIREPIIPLET